MRLNPSPMQTQNRAGFSLVEVVLAVGVLAVSVLALLGMMGPSFRQVKSVTDNNAAISIISKFNALIQENSFSDVYEMVVQSASGQNSNLAVMLFYQEEQFDTGTIDGTRYRDRVALIANGVTNLGNKGFLSISELAGNIGPSSSDWRVVPPVVAVVVSLSPMVKDIPNANSISYNEATPYESGGRMFPNYSGLPSSAANYNFGMLPIMASVFIIPNLNEDIADGNFNLTARNRVFTLTNRAFTFQAVKLR